MEQTRGQQQLSLGQALEPSLPIRADIGHIPQYEDIVLTPDQIEQASLEWPSASPKQQEARMRMRILNKLRNQIVVDEKTGRRLVGGPQPGSGAKRKRVGQTLVEATEERQHEIIDAAFSALHPSLPPEVRHKAAMNLTREAREEKKLEIVEDELDKADGQELAQAALGVVKELLASGEISLSELGMMGEVVDADVVE